VGLIFGRRPRRRAARGARGRGGFRGPFPYYTGRTRRGTRVTVTGCCLPIPLALGAGSLLAARAFLRR
jgi:hypothetical protein